MNVFLRFAILFSWVLLLVACGGGGGGSGGGTDDGGGRAQLENQVIHFGQPGPIELQVGEAFSNSLLDGPGTGAIGYQTGNPAVASVDTAGKVTALAPGETSISARKAADTRYNEASAAYVLKVVAAAPEPVANAWPASWHTFQSDAQHTGFVPVTLDPRRFSKLWSYPLPETYDAPQQVVADAESVYVSKSRYRVALDAFNGRARWKQYAELGSLPPLLAGGRVYFQNVHSDDSYLWAYNSTSGEQLYRVPYGNQWSEFTAPVSAGNTLFAGAGDFGGIKAFNAANGSSLWHFMDVDCQFFSPTLSDRHVIVYTGGASSRLALLDPVTGNEVGSIADPDTSTCMWPAGFNSSPVLAGSDSVLYTQNGRLLHFDLANRAIRWQLPSGTFMQPAVNEDEIYVIHNGSLEVRNLQDSSLKWAFSRNPATYRDEVLLTRNLAFVQDGQRVDAIDLVAREVVWSYPSGGALSMSNGVLYISTVSEVVAIDLLGDRDGNGLFDIWETRYGISNPAADGDQDGLTSIQEQQHGLSPFKADEDGDTLSDGEEVIQYHSDPFLKDTDGDGLADAAEIRTHGSDPNRVDSDEDHLYDLAELNAGLDPRNPADGALDEDGDGFSNRLEIFAGSDLRNASAIPVAQWTMYQGNASHNGYVPVELDVDNFAFRWSYTGEGELNAGLEVNGVVYVSAKYGARYTRALRATDAAQLWNYEFVPVYGPSFVYGASAPSFANGLVYLHVNARPQSGRSDVALIALNAGTGTEKFKHTYPSVNVDSEPFRQVTLYGDAVCFRYDNWYFACADAMTSATRWRIPLGYAGLGYEYPVYRNQVVVANSSLDIYDLNSGAALFSVADVFGYQPPLVGSMDDVLVMAENGIKSIDLASRKQKWFTFADYYIWRMAAGNNRVYALVDGALVAYNEQNGAKLWQWQPDGEVLESNLVVTASHVFVGSRDRTYAVNAFTGEREWTFLQGGELSFGNGNSLMIASGSSLSIYDLD